jgi:hypothetical protein
VYIVKCGRDPVYKIGVTHGQVDERVKSLQAGCPYPLWLVFARERYNIEFLESCLCEKYGARRLIGEWFSLTDVEFKSLCGTLQTDV